MRILFLMIIILTALILNAQKTMNYKSLTPDEQYVIVNKCTERPFSGKYNNHHEKGIYKCKQCGNALYSSEDKFDSGCGWPSFDDEIPGAIKKVADADGQRTEIVCAKCNGHLGHVFVGEGFTPKNSRHCVNSISLDFISEAKTSKAIFASGCFWGVQYHFNKEKGVIKTLAGYTGGHVKNPTYEEVCTGTTGHAEAVEVIFDTALTDYETLLKLYFETHNFTQIGGQGPDIGEQYRSVIFYTDNQQKAIAEKLIKHLEEKNYKVATKLEKATQFYPAEEYHQDYYFKRGGSPYCHIKKKVF